MGKMMDAVVVVGSPFLQNMTETGEKKPETPPLRSRGVMVSACSRRKSRRACGAGGSLQ